jgi:hypothetical protein
MMTSSPFSTRSMSLERWVFAAWTVKVDTGFLRM